jgi:hypothetical protein
MWEQEGVPRKRRTQSVVPAPPVWDQRSIILVGSRADVERICRDWEAEAWQVMTIDDGPPTAAGHTTHVVRVAVPPVGWQSAEQLLAEAE